ncbi:MAG: 5'/3'-nucleotidase SurE [Bacteroidales bacterium]|jgi:5'-nucleotidase|nr:5'/3'-nucleotidase SurE [Bacteroidales bacterium]
MNILVTNDDGYHSNGIITLAQIMSSYGKVTVVAPLRGQSGKASSLTINRNLDILKMPPIKNTDGSEIDVYAVNGTPADCVKMACCVIYKSGNPDIIAAGINHGSNSSASAIYSGTLGAVKEGALRHIHSIAFSSAFDDPEADLSAVREYSGKIMKNFLSDPPQEGIYLNINFPPLPSEDIKGIKIAKQGSGRFLDEFHEEINTKGEKSYYLQGRFEDMENDPMGDHKLLREGYISIVPHQLDTTCYHELERLKKDWKL